MRYLNMKRLREVIPILELYFEDLSEISELDIVYPMLFLNELSEDLNTFSK